MSIRKLPPSPLGPAQDRLGLHRTNVALMELEIAGHVALLWALNILARSRLTEEQRTEVEAERYARRKLLKHLRAERKRVLRLAHMVEYYRCKQPKQFSLF